MLVALAIHWMATERRIDRVLEMSNIPTWSADRPELDPQSPTGFKNGQRSLIVPGGHNASYFWIVEAQQAAHSGNLRIREIKYDAMPEGRTIDRASPYRLWLISVGWFHSVFSGQSLGYSIEQGTHWADPLLFALMLVFGSIYSARYFGSIASAGFAITCVSIFPLAGNFQPGAPDPHSLSWVLAVTCLLPLLVALRYNNRKTQPTLHLLLSGTISGLGVWSDASTGMPVILAIFLGGLTYEIILMRDRIVEPACVNRWRRWGTSAAVVTLAGGLYECVPGHLTLSLESINPLHALVILGFGECLRTLSLMLKGVKSGLEKSHFILLGLSFLAILVWPVVGLISESGSLLASDFYARELANHPNGAIASSLSKWINEEGQGGSKFAILLSIAIVFVSTLRITRETDEKATSGLIALTSIAAILALILGYFELRWWNLFNAFTLALVLCLLAGAENWKPGKMFQRSAVLLLFIPGLFLSFPSAASDDVANSISQVEKQALVGRDYSYWLNQRRGEETPVVLSTHIFSNLLAYYGGFGTILSSDDGSEDGYHAAVRILSTSTIQEATILLNDKGITHIALPLWDPLLDRMIQTGAGVRPGEALPPNAFAVALREWDFPLWLRPLAYTIPPKSDFSNFQIRSFALGPELEEELRLSRLADMFVEQGERWSFRAMGEGLKAYPRSPIALGALANIELASQNKDALEETLETLIPYLSRRSARNLPSDRRASLAILFARTKRLELAKEQLQTCFKGLNAEALKSMTPTTVAGLLALSNSLEVPFPSSELRSTALSLVSPQVRDLLPKSK